MIKEYSCQGKTALSTYIKFALSTYIKLISLIGGISQAQSPGLLRTVLFQNFCMIILEISIWEYTGQFRYIIYTNLFPCL